jgi:hypothetical protein
MNRFEHGFFDELTKLAEMSTFKKVLRDIGIGASAGAGLGKLKHVTVKADKLDMLAKDLESKLDQAKKMFGVETLMPADKVPDGYDDYVNQIWDYHNHMVDSLNNIPASYAVLPFAAAGSLIGAANQLPDGINDPKSVKRFYNKLGVSV